MKPSPKLTFLLLLLSAAASTATPLLHPADFVALQSLHSSLRDSPGSKFFSSWDFTSDPCNFSGVLCEGDRVVALRLGEPRAGSPGLMGRLDPSLGRFSALTQLSLVPGRVAGPIPSSIAQLSKLRFLGLSRNLLSGQIPREISSLRLLQTLDLSFNLLSGIIPQELNRLPSLANLVLGNNQISGSVPNFSKCSSLLRLDLKRNNLSGEIPAIPPSLRYLSLSSNRLAGSIERTLPLLRELRYLDLGRNRLTGTIPAAVFTLPATHLRLQRNMFSGPVLPAKTVEIPIVDLSFNRLSGEVSPMFSSVKRLFLNNNLLTGKVPESLVEGLGDSNQQLAVPPLQLHDPAGGHRLPARRRGGEDQTSRPLFRRQGRNRDRRRSLKKKTMEKKISKRKLPDEIAVFPFSTWCEEGDAWRVRSPGGLDSNFRI